MSLKILTEAVHASYENVQLHPERTACDVPSNREVKRLVGELKRLVMPGYHGERMRAGSSFFATRLVVRSARRRLRGIILKVLHYLGGTVTDLRRSSRTLADAFLTRVPAVREALAADLEAFFDGDPAAFNRDQIVLSYPGFYAIAVYRIAHELVLAGVPFLPRMMTEFAHRETGIDIHPGATIGKGFMIDHGTGVVIGETTVVGDRVRLYQGVTLGALSTRGGRMLAGRKRHPTIGDDVTIYAGASILGGDTVIGSGATIGSNVFITESVAPGVRVSIRTPELLVKERKNDHERP